MTKAESYRETARTLQRWAQRFQREAERAAQNGCVWSAALLSDKAYDHRRMAAQFECDAIAHEGA